MTTVYFIRHAESDIAHRDGRTRPLTDKGLAERGLVAEFLNDKDIGAVLSSPFKRSVDTVSPFATSAGLEIETDEGFRERASDSDWLRETDFYSLMERQWSDFQYTLSDGECLAEVQERNIAALNKALMKYKNQNIAIGTHGTALSTIINYYDSTYGYKEFMDMVNIMPWVTVMYFDGANFAGMRKIDLFQPNAEPSDKIWKVRVAGCGELKAYRFVVCFAHYRDKWLYCRAKSRDTYETAGGHIEQGEAPIDAARRELYEETGAIADKIVPAYDYSVHTSQAYSFGQVFYADIAELGAMPDYEMAEVRPFESYPDKMRFPQILPVLYDGLQRWLSAQLK